MMLLSRTVRIVLMVFITALLAGCFGRTAVPSNQENLCSIYRQNPSWYKDSIAASKRWGGPIYVSMAIMAQESSFRAKAKPPMRYFLGVIPYGRASNAYGYPQALDSTWKSYQKSAGKRFAQRDNFDDAIDFIHWYMQQSFKVNGVKKSDAFAHYLNYHEGQGGYRRGSYKSKGWLINTAKRVAARAGRYQEQLKTCSL